MNQAKGLYPILLVIVAIAISYFFTYPQWGGLSVNKASLAVAEQQNSRLKDSEAQLNSFLNDYRSNAEVREKAGKALPLKKSEVESLLANLDKFAADSGISVDSTAFTEAGQASGVRASLYQLTYVEVNMAVSGSYPSFRAFLMNLENSLRIFDIHNLNILSGNGESGTLDYRIVARIYYQK